MVRHNSLVRWYNTGHQVLVVDSIRWEVTVLGTSLAYSCGCVDVLVGSVYYGKDLLFMS